MVNVRRMVFKDLLNQLPQGTKKMTNKIYIKEEILESFWSENSEKYLKSVEAKQRADWAKHVVEFPGLHKKDETYEESISAEVDLSLRNWMARCDAIDDVSAAIKEAREWLQDNGYIRMWYQERGTMKFLWTGITPKGWSIAHLYR